MIFSNVGTRPGRAFFGRGGLDKRPLTFALVDRKRAHVFIKEGILLMLVVRGETRQLDRALFHMAVTGLSHTHTHTPARASLS